MSVDEFRYIFYLIEKYKKVYDEDLISDIRFYLEAIPLEQMLLMKYLQKSDFKYYLKLWRNKMLSRMVEHMKFV